MNRTVKKSSNSESSTVFWMPPPSSATLENLSQKVTPQAIREWLMSLQQDSPANRSALPEKDSQKKTNETCGLKQSHAFVSYDLNTHSWKTSQTCLITGTFSEFLETWPKAGIVCGFDLYPRPMWERYTHERDNGFLLPTILKFDAVGGHLIGKNFYGNKHAMKINQALQIPTILRNEIKGCARKRFKGSKNYRGGKASEALRICETDPIYLNPSFAEWMFGLPAGWTALQPLGICKFQGWLKQHGNF